MSDLCNALIRECHRANSTLLPLPIRVDFDMEINVVVEDVFAQEAEEPR